MIRKDGNWMFKRLRNHKAIMIVVLILLLFVTACSSRTEEDLNFDQGELNLTVNIASTSKQTELDKMVVELVNQSDSSDTYSDSQDISVRDDQASFNFSNLKVDATYKIEAVIKDINGDKVYQGSGAKMISDSPTNTSIEVNPISAFEEITLHFKPSDSNVTPHVHTWYETDQLYKPTGEWNNQSAMSVEHDGWYQITINSSQLSNYQKGTDFGVIVTDGSENKLTGSADTFVSDFGEYWWDGSDWTTENLSGPAKPKITVTPNGGAYIGDQTISIEINSDSTITSISCQFAGQTIDLSSGAANITLSNYIADGNNGDLIISATNDVGTREPTITFSRNDNPPAPDKFTWNNASVYFVLTDRFYNGDTSNDNSYGRRKNPTGGSAATFHGGDIEGLTQKLESGYFEKLGVNAIWITAPYEQIHGFVGGGYENDEANLAHYGYHGYYALDYTKMDKNMGTVAEFRNFVNTAHEQGIRIVMDVVMNHFGYENIVDAAQYGYGATGMSVSEAKNWEPSDGNWDKVNDQYNGNWDDWLSSDWVRKDKYNNTVGGTLKKCLAGLPDIKTEVTTDQGLPPILQTKWSQAGSEADKWIVPEAQDLRQDLGVPPAGYLKKWITAWIEEFGIDGFRVDTAKHVGKERWGELKAEAISALEDWRANNPNAPGASWDEQFWMVGEVYGHGVGKSDYFADNNGDGINDFDSVINFNFPKDGDLSNIDSVWEDYANQLNSDSEFNVLSYISSHDTSLGALGNKINAGTTFLLSPGGVQLFYGDEVDRQPAPNAYDHKTRSDYPWSNQDQAVLEHWQKLGQFRENHPAVGAGQQKDLGNNTYGRTWDGNSDGLIDDKIVIKINGSGISTVNVNGIFANGVTVRNAYTGKTATVNNGEVEFEFNNQVILIEKVE